MAEANDYEGRIGDLEKWQGVVEYRLDQGEQQFKEIHMKLVQQDERTNQMGINILNGNRDTSELKRSWEEWLKDWKAAKANGPEKWQTAILGISAIVALGSLIVAIIALTHVGGKP